MANVWLETTLAAGATKTVTMTSGSGPTGNETAWSGNFVLASGADNCPADWTLQSAMAGYFPLPGAASWGATQAGGHTHLLDFQLDTAGTFVTIAMPGGGAYSQGRSWS